MKTLYIPIIVSFLASTASAKLFSNSYISFQLPPNWSCKVAGTEWVCRSSVAEQARQAIIVLTAKEVGPNDNFAYYNQYLKTSKTPKNKDGTVAAKSKVVHLKTVQIKNHAWIDSLHLGSLLPKFYSRYLVTIKDKIAILVTFSAKKEYYTRYSQHFFDAINSLKVTATMNSRQGGLKSPNEALGVDIDAAMDDGAWAGGGDQVSGGGQKGSNLWLYGAALGLASIGGFFLFKKRRG